MELQLVFQDNDEIISNCFQDIIEIDLDSEMADVSSKFGQRFFQELSKVETLSKNDEDTQRAELNSISAVLPKIVEIESTQEATFVEYMRSDVRLVHDLYVKIALKHSNFAGAMPQSLGRQDLHHINYNSHVVSLKIDGIRAWYIVWKQSIYLHLRDGRVFFLGKARWSDDVLCDCEVLSTDKGMKFVLYDILYYNMSLMALTFFSRYAYLKKMKSTDLDGVVIQQYFSVDMIESISIGEGLVFTPTSVSYRFGLNEKMFAWKVRGTTLDLRYDKGKLYSAVYDKKRNFSRYQCEGKIGLNKRDGIVVEVRPLMVLNGVIYQYIRDRLDKDMPNANMTVFDVMTKGNVVLQEIVDVFRKMRKFYTPSGLLSYYKPNVPSDLIRRGKHIIYRHNDFRGMQEFMIDQYSNFRAFDVVYELDENDEFYACPSVYFQYPIIHFLFYGYNPVVKVEKERCSRHGSLTMMVYKYKGIFIQLCSRDYSSEDLLTIDVYEWIIKHWAMDEDGVIKKAFEW